MYAERKLLVAVREVSHEELANDAKRVGAPELVEAHFVGEEKVGYADHRAAL